MQFFYQWYDAVSGWVAAHPFLVTGLLIGSVLFVVAAILLIPWLILRIPSDYFSSPGRYRSALLGNHLIAALMFKLLRNCLALVLISIGFVLLFLPGQGLITIFLGVVMADFPGKHRLMNWLVSRQGVLSSMNWWRGRAGKSPIEPPNI